MAEGGRWFWALLHELGTGLLLFGLVGAPVASVFLFDLPGWAVTTIALAVLFLVFAAGAYRVWRDESDRGFDPDAPKVPVVGQAFRNERVVLDGHSYSACTFENVTLVFQGRKFFDLAHCTFTGLLWFDFTDSVPAHAVVTMLAGLGILPGSVDQEGVFRGPIDLPPPPDDEQDEQAESEN